MRYTEYHAGVAVIKKNQTKGAAAKLAFCCHLHG